jgi:hypothetical protein
VQLRSFRVRGPVQPRASVTMLDRAKPNLLMRRSLHKHGGTRLITRRALSGRRPLSRGCLWFAAKAGAPVFPRRHIVGLDAPDLNPWPYVFRTRSRDPTSPVNADPGDLRNMHSGLYPQHRLLRWAGVDRHLQRWPSLPVDHALITAAVGQPLLQGRSGAMSDLRPRCAGVARCR